MKVFGLFREYPYEGEEMIRLFECKKDADVARDDYIQNEEIDEGDRVFVEIRCIDVAAKGDSNPYGN